jgi:hypothetical protein
MLMEVDIKRGTATRKTSLMIVTNQGETIITLGTQAGYDRCDNSAK